MAHFASNRYRYTAQLGILLAFAGAGIIIGTIASIIPMLSKVSFADLKSGSEKALESLMIPANANIIRWMQFLTTFFTFLLPAFFYAKLCHQKASLHLGFNKNITIAQAALMIAIMIAAAPLVDVLQSLTKMLPWSKAMLQQFKDAEVMYNKQVGVIARMNGFGDFIISLIMVALLPAIFEEMIFRGALQNLFTRWFKMPLIAIIVTSIIFSAVHGSYLGFLSRFALGFVLGWIYYRTGNLWLTIIGHFFNNAAGITYLYITSVQGKPIDPSAVDSSLPLWAGAISVIALIALFILFEKISKNYIDRPGEEVLLDNENPLLAAVDNIGNNNSSPTTQA